MAKLPTLFLTGRGGEVPTPEEILAMFEAITARAATEDEKAELRQKYDAYHKAKQIPS